MYYDFWLLANRSQARDKSKAWYIDISRKSTGQKKERVLTEWLCILNAVHVFCVSPIKKEREKNNVML